MIYFDIINGAPCTVCSYLTMILIWFANYLSECTSFGLFNNNFWGPRQTYLTVRRGKQFFMCTIAEIKRISKGSDLTKNPLRDPKFEHF